MSRSRKQAIIKYKGDKTYNKRFRRINKQMIHEGKELMEMNSVMDPNEVCRYTVDLEHKNKSHLKKNGKNLITNNYRRK